MYVWQKSGWPHFEWNPEALIAPLGEARSRQGALLGRMTALGMDLKTSAQLEAETEELVQSSKIEGEVLSPQSVRSSLGRRLGVEKAALGDTTDAKTEGVVEMHLDATQKHAEPLTSDRLFGWHAALFPSGRSGLQKIEVAKFRSGQMQVVSGLGHKEKVHFEAPPPKRLPAEMKAFFKWLNAAPSTDGLLVAGLAHFWFVTVHPFDDGNGRIARAIGELCLSRMEKSSRRYYSVSSQLQKERKDYYSQLERAQKGSLDVTGWLEWFLGVYTRALHSAWKRCDEVFARAELWRRRDEEPMNERQRAMVKRLLDGLEGKLTAPRWAALMKCSVDSAQRDLKELVERKVLVRNPGGSKNTSYGLAL